MESCILFKTSLRYIIISLDPNNVYLKFDLIN